MNAAVQSHRRSLRAAMRLPAYSDARRELIRLADLALALELGAAL